MAELRAASRRGLPLGAAGWVAAAGPRGPWDPRLAERGPGRSPYGFWLGREAPRGTRWSASLQPVTGLLGERRVTNASVSRREEPRACEEKTGNR